MRLLRWILRLIIIAAISKIISDVLIFLIRIIVFRKRVSKMSEEEYKKFNDIASNVMLIVCLVVLIASICFISYKSAIGT